MTTYMEEEEEEEEQVHRNSWVNDCPVSYPGSYIHDQLVCNIVPFELGNFSELGGEGCHHVTGSRSLLLYVFIYSSRLFRIGGVGVAICFGMSITD